MFLRPYSTHTRIGCDWDIPNFRELHRLEINTCQRAASVRFRTYRLLKVRARLSASNGKPYPDWGWASRCERAGRISITSTTSQPGSRRAVPNQAIAVRVSASIRSCAAPVSACRAFRSTASRTGPGGSSLACSRRCLASSARRSSSDGFCLKRRRFCMRCSFPLEEGGSATGVLITDRYLEPCGDKETMPEPAGGYVPFDTDLSLYVAVQAFDHQRA